MRIMRNNPIVRAITMLGMLFAMLLGTLPASAATLALGAPNLIVLGGWPDQVNAADVDKSDHKPFTHTIGMGTEQALGDPGKLLVGPDEKPAIVNGSEGSIEYINPLNQIPLVEDRAYSIQVPEGGYIGVFAAKAQIDVDGHHVELWGQDGNQHIFILRGRNVQPGDQNTTAVITGFIPGHAVVEIYPAGKHGGGFVSEAGTLQKVATAHTGGTNCGFEGCDQVTLSTGDLNTLAFSAVTQRGLNGAWTPLLSNWWHS